MPEQPWIRMVGGGSNKRNARLERQLTANHIPHQLVGKYHPSPGSKHFWESKEVLYDIHPDYVQQARALGMRVKREYHRKDRP